MISVAIPCYCSENTVDKVVNELVAMFEEHNERYQIVLVNDGSTDKTFAVLKKLSAKNSHIVAIDLSRNYGQHAARMAAIPYIKGDYIVYMDDDGQHPVTGIYLMFNKLINGGYDVVYAYFKHKQHSFFQRLASAINTETLYLLAGKPKSIKNSGFSIMRRFVLEEMKKYKSPFPSFGGFVQQITHNIANVEIEHGKRISGASNYTLKKMMKAYATCLTGFSIVPLRIASLIGIACAGSGFVVLGYLCFRKLFCPDIIVAGYTSIISAILIVGGGTMMMLGIIGEYLGRLYMIANNMPQYSVREAIGADFTTHM